MVSKCVSPSSHVSLRRFIGRSGRRRGVLLACGAGTERSRRSRALRAAGLRVVVTPLQLRAAEQIIAMHTRLRDLDAALVYLCDEPGSGLVLFWALRQNHPTLPIVVVAPWADKELLDEILEHGPFVVLEPPVPTEVAVATMLNASAVAEQQSRIAV